MKYIIKIRWILIFGIQWIVYAKLFNYLFIYIEQTQLFLFSSSYAIEMIGRPGGICSYIAAFLTQFYLIPYVGAAITALLLTGIAWLTRCVLVRISTAGKSCLLYAVPALSLMILHFDFNYYVQGSAAYLLMLLCLFIYGKTSGKLRFLTACLFPVCLFFIAGSVAVLYTVIVILYDLLTERYKAVYVIPPLCLISMCCLLSLYFSWTSEWRFTIGPQQYFMPTLKVSKIYYSWIALPVVMMIAFGLRKQVVSNKMNYFRIGLQWGLVCIAGYGGIRYFGELRSMKLKEMDYFVRLRDWKKVIESFDTQSLSVQRTVMLNLALAEQGALSEELFDYPQKGIISLMSGWDRTAYSASLLSDIYYCMGLPSVSQKFAFEALEASRASGNPRSLKRLIETNVITGAYPVAEKYIHLLEQTLLYKGWATSFRRFLYNDQAVEQDPELALKRRCWEAEKTLPGVYKDPVSTLKYLMPAVPENKAGMDYLVSFVLLAKDMENYRELLGTLFRTPAWPSLSENQQEAVVICNPNDTHFWLRNGVSMRVQNRAVKFMNTVREHAMRKDVMQLMASDYGNTYWYYYMFLND